MRCLRGNRCFELARYFRLSGLTVNIKVLQQLLLPNQASFLTRGGGHLTFIPSNLAIPDRDSCRNLLAGATEPHSPRPHLEEWHAIVRSGNKAKNRIARFRRIFRLQHYWMVLQKRWQYRLDRRVEQLHLSFAAWLMPTNREGGLDTIRKDLSLIGKARGGNRWYRKPNALDHF